MKRSNLDYFGEVLIKNVRDHSIEIWERILSGQMKSPESQDIFKKLNHLRSEEKEYLIDLFSQVVDTTLHHLLVSIEEDEFIDIVVSKEKSGETVIKEISDGLAGELYTEDGWICQFSAKRKFI